MQHLNETFVFCQKGVMSILGKIFPPHPSGQTSIFLAFIKDLDQRWVTSGIWYTGGDIEIICFWNDQLSIISTQLTSLWLLNVLIKILLVLINRMTNLWFFIYKWTPFDNHLAHYPLAPFHIPSNNYSILKHSPQYCSLNDKPRLCVLSFTFSGESGPSEVNAISNPSMHFTRFY